jgi:hypothetical protein
LGKKAVFTASSPQALNRETRRGAHFSTFFTVTISTFLRARQHGYSGHKHQKGEKVIAIADN